VNNYAASSFETWTTDAVLEIAEIIHPPVARGCHLERVERGLDLVLFVHLEILPAIRPIWKMEATIAAEQNKNAEST
jgi:hypothetical protein